jgi:hypothetical protein
MNRIGTAAYAGKSALGLYDIPQGFMRQVEVQE